VSEIFSPDLLSHLPTASEPHRVLSLYKFRLHNAAGKFQWDPQPAAFLLDHRRNRQARGFIVRIELLLPSVRIDDLAEISFLIKQPDADHRRGKIAGGFHVIAGQHAETAGVKRQCRTETELHAEVCDAGNAIAAVGGFEPSWLGEIGLSRGSERLQSLLKGGIGGEPLEALRGRALQHAPRIACAVPQLVVDLPPQRIGFVAPGPAQIEREIAKFGNAFWQIGKRQRDHV